MSGDPTPLKRLFPNKHIPVILSSILQVGGSVQKKTRHDREDWITRRLHARIVRLPSFRDGPVLNIQFQPEIPSDDIDSDTPAGRIDLLVSCNRGYQVYFAIEAKRLRYRSRGGRFKTGGDEYVKNGMMRFVNGKYAPFMETGAMLGYVFDGQTAMARSDVDRNIQGKSGELKIKFSKRLEQSQILPAQSVDETRHDLNNRCFTIYHIFLAI